MSTQITPNKLLSAKLVPSLKLFESHPISKYKTGMIKMRMTKMMRITGLARIFWALSSYLAIKLKALVALNNGESSSGEACQKQQMERL